MGQCVGPERRQSVIPSLEDCFSGLALCDLYNLDH